MGNPSGLNPSREFSLYNGSIHSAPRFDARLALENDRRYSGSMCKDGTWGELQKDVLMSILPFEVTILVDPARSHSQAAQASAAAKIRTTAANRKLVKFHKDVCSQWASSHYQAKQALLATQQRWTFSSLQNETLSSKRPF